MADKVTIRVGGSSPAEIIPPAPSIPEPPAPPSVTVSDVIATIVAPKAVEPALPTSVIADPPAPPVLPMIAEPAVVVTPPKVDLPPPPELPKTIEVIATPVSSLTRTVTVKQATAIPAAMPQLPPVPSQPVMPVIEPPIIKQVTTASKRYPAAQVLQGVLYTISILILLSAIWITYSRVNNKPLALISQTVEATKTIVEPLIEQQKQVPNKTVKVPPVTVRSIVGVKKYYVAYQLSDGRIEKRTGGSRSWRLNNPGRLMDTNYTRAYGALGVSEKMAIFPTYQAGRRALIDMFFVRPEMKWMDHTLASAIKNFVPASVAKDYLDEVLKLVDGVTETTVMKNFTVQQREAFANAVEQLEVFQKGRVEIYDSIDVYKEKG